MKKLMRLLMAAIMLMLLCGSTATAEDVRVKKVTVDTKPNKMVYMIGEEFEPEGGVLKVTYSDKSTALIPMTDENVTFSGTSLTSEGKKSVTVEFGGKSARLSVTVSGAGYTVTLNENYDGGEISSASVVGGSTLSDPHAAREGYTLDGWYTDEDFKQKFSFDQPINSDLTLYACWLKEGVEVVEVTFDYGYYGDLMTSYIRLVNVGDEISRPVDPVRVGYAFDGWTLDGEEYDFSSSVTGNITLLAVWHKTVEGIQSYTFEAEDTDLTGKVGVGSSGASVERSMIQYDATGAFDASNDRWVGYLYKPNLSLDFYFASDVEVEDAVLSLSVATELPGTYVYDPESYAVMLNGKALEFTPFTMEMSDEDFSTRNIHFETVMLAKNVSLKAGANELQIYPINTTTINGTTYQAVSPLVDCVKIDTSAVLIWDATKGLPADNY